MTLSEVCLFYKFGHCKFQGTCRKRHIETICEKEGCDIQNCNERHPRECSFFRDYKRCKFGSFCSFKHESSEDEKVETLKKEISYMKTRVEKLENDIALKNKEIEFILKALKGVSKPTTEKKDPKNLVEKTEYEHLETEEKIRSQGEVNEKSINLHPKFKCYLCSEFLPTISDLMKHHNWNHNEHPKKLVCEICDETCTHVAMLISHKETKHRIYTCAKCNSQFYGKENIDDHIKKKHS